MALSVLEANLCDHGPNAQALLDQGYDLLVIPEAYRENEADHMAQIWSHAAYRGYQAFAVPYSDTDQRKDQHGLVMFAKSDIVARAETIRMGVTNEERLRGIGRAALKLCIRDRTTGAEADIFGVHLDDRTEKTRLAQAQTLMQYASKDKPTAIIGDLNSASRQGVHATVRTAALRLLGHVARRFPSVEPGASKPASMKSAEGIAYLCRRGASVFGRLGEMCTGQTLGYFLKEGFKDDDSRHRATMSNKYPIIKLDHFLTRNGIVAITSPRKHKNSLGDHRMLSGYICFPQDVRRAQRSVRTNR